MTKEITKDDENMIDGHVGARIRQRRKTMGLSQTELATEIGVKFQQVQKYETGANRVSASRLFLIAETLQVDLGYFFSGLPAMYAVGGGIDPLSPRNQIEAEILQAIRLCSDELKMAVLAFTRDVQKIGGDA